MSADLSPKPNNTQIVLVTALAAIHLAMMVPSVPRSKASERGFSGSTSASLQRLSRPDTSAPVGGVFAGSDLGAAGGDEGRIDSSQQARAEIAR